MSRHYLAGWHEQGVNFPCITKCNYADAARRPRGANRRQAQPFMIFSAGSEGNETARFARLTRPLASADTGITVLLSGEEAQSCQRCMKHNRVKHLSRAEKEALDLLAGLFLHLFLSLHGNTISCASHLKRSEAHVWAQNYSTIQYFGFRVAQFCRSVVLMESSGLQLKLFAFSWVIFFQSI